MISINDFANMVIGISGKAVRVKNIPGPQGVRGRNSDNALIVEKVGWKPAFSLHEGMQSTYHWVLGQVRQAP
jgi:nucleoside-diphosphate-sugar epimerase